jgi:hypothetical protein
MEHSPLTHFGKFLNSKIPPPPMGGHKRIHGYSAEYPLFFVKKNQALFSQPSTANSAFFLACQHLH